MQDAYRCAADCLFACVNRFRHIFHVRDVEVFIVKIYNLIKKVLDEIFSTEYKVNSIITKDK